jgi:hypothetical protein
MVEGVLEDSLELRECSKCHEKLPLDMFVKDASCLGGRARRCKPCANKVRANWEANRVFDANGNPILKSPLSASEKEENHLASSLKFYYDNKESVLEKMGEYRNLFKDKINARKRAQYPLQDANKRRNTRLLWGYGITLDRYNEILEFQGGTCAYPNCNTSREKNGNYLSVDHNHACCPGSRSCGKCVRGLLCTYHNGKLIDYEWHLWSVGWWMKGV